MQRYQGGGQRLGGDGGGYDPFPTGNSDFDFNFDGINPCVGASLVCTLIAFLGLGGLATTSLGTVPPLHYGLVLNSYTKVVDNSTIYDPGRYFIGPWNNFVLFPAVAQNIEFVGQTGLVSNGMRYPALSTRTKDGLALDMQVAFQYKLVKEHIGELYSKFKNYEAVFTSVARDILIKAASDYEAPQLWREREKFCAQMQSMLNKELEKTWAQCWSLQLIVIDLPNTFEHSLIKTQVQEQEMLVRQQEQVSAQIRAETDVIQAEYARNVKVILAEGQANYTVLTKEAEAEARRRKIGVETDIIGMLRRNLTLDGDGLVRYQRFSSMEDLPDAQILYGFNGPQQLLVRQQGGSR